MQPNPDAKPPVYQRPVAGQAVTSILYKDAKTPKIKVKFSNIINPFRYPNSPTIPRWSITCLLDPGIESDHEFIGKIEKLEAKESIQGSQTLKDDVFKDREGQIVKSGKYIMKFQTRDKIPVIVMKPGFPQIPAELKQEIAFGDSVIIVFDVVRYTKKGVSIEMNKGISYQPKMIYLYPFEGEEESNYDQEPV